MGRHWAGENDDGDRLEYIENERGEIEEYHNGKETGRYGDSERWDDLIEDAERKGYEEIADGYS